ncbi:2-iminoacetate synthase ThiH [bacterium]|nr:2-iminoacetate synthase ThiH [bacterium]
MNTFDIEQLESPEVLAEKMAAVTHEAIEASLRKLRLHETDLINLLSPLADDYLEIMAHRAHAITAKRFGRIMKLYAPLYLSNECSNACCYCGFNCNHTISRRTLKIEEVVQQADYLAQRGFQNVLLVSGESRQHVPMDFLVQCIQRIKDLLPEISVEVYPLEKDEYRYLGEAGLYGLAIYQETYFKKTYAAMHPAGRKQDYAYRLKTPERGARAGLRQIGIGVLLGLADFRVDGYYLAQHARYLEKFYWRTIVGVSFPRIRQAQGGFQPPMPVSDRQLVQLVTALRLYLPDAPFSLSTREPDELRRNLLPLGFTQMSAESCTAPGGYGNPSSQLEQFQVEDTRSASVIADELAQLHFEPVWKDWDESFDRHPAQVK